MARKDNMAQGESVAFNLEGFKMEVAEIRAKELKGRTLTAENNVNLGNLLHRIDAAWKAAGKDKPRKPQLQKELGVNAAEWSRLTTLATWVAEQESKKKLPAPGGDTAGDRAQEIMDKLYTLRQGAKAEAKAKEKEAKAKAEPKAKAKGAPDEDAILRMADAIADGVWRILGDKAMTDEQYRKIVNMAAEVIERG